MILKLNSTNIQIYLIVTIAKTKNTHSLKVPIFHLEQTNQGTTNYIYTLINILILLKILN